MDELDGLKESLTDCHYALNKIEEYLLIFYEKFPALFSKTPKEMSATDKLKVGSQIIKLINNYTEEVPE